MAMYTDEDLFKVLNTLIDLQLNDIEKSFSSEADILCVIGCMNLIEFMGGVHNGKLGKKGQSEQRFKEGIKLLGSKWANNNYLGEDTMWNLRNALVHQFIPEASNIGIFGILGTHIRHFVDFHAIKPPHFKTGGHIPRYAHIVIPDLIYDLKHARARLIDDLKNNDNLREKLNRTLWWLPKLQEETGLFTDLRKQI